MTDMNATWLESNVHNALNKTIALWDTNQSVVSTTGPQLTRALLLLLLLPLLIVCTVVGNCLVCLAVCLVPRIRRQPYTLLYVSLAVADLFVAGLVMPLALLHLYLGRWPLGRTLCDLFVAVDVLSCTASILNLCAISVDRYRAITRPLQYSRQRGAKLMAIYIGAVWSGSIVISIVPIVIIGNEHGDGSLCTVNQNLYYQIWATLMSFYLPLAIMIFVYMKILRAAKRIVRQERISQGHLPKVSEAQINERQQLMVQTLKTDAPANFSSLQPVSNDVDLNDCERRDSAGVSGCCEWPVMVPREKKASVTLGIIMTTFIVCWLPFFILAVVRPLFRLENIPNVVTDVFLWLGYINSFLNPFIYVTFNKDFRKPFKEILCCRCRSLKMHLRQEQYLEQYGASRLSMSQGVTEKRHLHCHVPKCAQPETADTVTVACRRNSDGKLGAIGANATPSSIVHRSNYSCQIGTSERAENETEL